jgi:anti-sigma-K factor RskA
MTAQGTDHDALRESAGLYALGALPPDEQSAFEAHMKICVECAEEVRSLGDLTAALAQSVPQIDPPLSLRARVLAGSRPAGAPTMVRPAQPARIRWVNPGWLSAAALLVVTVGLGAYTTALRQRIGGLELQLHDAVARLDRSEREAEAATRALSSTQLRMAVLTAPDLARVDLSGQPPAPRAAGRAFWSRTRGLVFAASSLPPLPAGQIYQLWVVTASRPISAGLIRPDANGSVTASFDTPPDIPAPVAIAVTLEPDGGVPAPTGDRYLIGLAS